MFKFIKSKLLKIFKPKVDIYDLLIKDPVMLRVIQDSENTLNRVVNKEITRTFVILGGIKVIIKTPGKF